MRRMLVGLGRAELEPARRVEVRHAVDQACDEQGQWRGAALLVFEHDGWSVFEDLSGCLGGIPAARWLELAGDDSLIVAGYNDSVPYGELVVVEGGAIRRAFLDDEQDPSSNVDAGEDPPLTSWIDVASIVDEDPFLVAKGNEALLWLLADSRPS